MKEYSLKEDNKVKETETNSNLPIQYGRFGKLKSFFKLELTAKQEKVFSEVHDFIFQEVKFPEFKEFMSQEITWSGIKEFWCKDVNFEPIKNFWCQEITFGFGKNKE